MTFSADLPQPLTIWNNTLNIMQGSKAHLRRGGLSLLGTLLACLCGCGEHYEAPTVFPVKGQVLLSDGKPLTTGSVVFVNKMDVEIPADIGSDGRFTMKTPSAEGIPSGEYRVRIDPEQRKAGAPRAKKSAPNLPYPPKYGDETTSGLTVTVQAGENNLEPFKLVAGSAGTDGGGKKEGSDR